MGKRIYVKEPYKILIVEEYFDGIKNKDHVEFVKLEEFEKTLNNNQYDLIYVKKQCITKEIEKKLKLDYLILPKIMEKMAINNEQENTYINIEIVNKVIMDNIKIIRFENYDEELIIANIIKQKMITPEEVENIYKPIYSDKSIKEREEKIINKVVKQDYSANSTLREIKFKMNTKEIIDKFIEKILNNITNEVAQLYLENTEVEKKVKILIADDNKGFCDLLTKLLINYEDIEVIGSAYTDEDEIRLIEELKPDIVITDLVRNHRYTGIEIIREYTNKENAPKFLVISADRKEDVIDKDLKIAGYIKKPCFDDNLIIEELRNIIKNDIYKSGI